MDNFVGTKLNSRRLARRAKGRMPEVSPLAAYAQLGLVNEVQLERGQEGFARGYLPLQYQRPKAAKSRHAVTAKGAARNRQAAAAAAISAQRADQPVGLGNRGKAGKQRQRWDPAGARSAGSPDRACGRLR